MLRRVASQSVLRQVGAVAGLAAAGGCPATATSSAFPTPRVSALRFHASGGGGGGKDYYKTLGVDKNADVKDIKKAYRKRALETHPDQGGKKEEFAEVAEAYEVLSNPEKRKLYDNYGSEAATNPNMGGMGGMGGRSAEDIFAEFFKGGVGGFGDMFGGMGGARQRGPPTVEPLEVRLRISLEEVYSGATKTIRVTRPQVCVECSGFGTKSKTEKPTCTQCNGQGQVVQQHRMGPGMIQQTISECPRCHGAGKMSKPDDVCPKCQSKGYRNVAQDVTIAIPAGIPSNVTMVVRGEGGTIPGAQPGDLHVHVEVNTHKTFQRRGEDLIVRKDVTLQEALLGLHMPLKMLDGRTINVETPSDAVLKPDGVVKITGEGMPSNTGGRGDIYIFTSLKMPAKLTKEQQDAVKKAFGEPKSTKAGSGATVKARVLRETQEQLEDHKRGVWAAQEGGSRGGGAGSAHGSSGGSGFRRGGGGGPQTAECAAQ